MGDAGFWYRQTLDDPIQRAMAFAAAGALTSAGWNPETESLGDRLDRIIKEAEEGSIPWKYPETSDIRPRREVTDRQLAGAWRYGHGKRRRSARLVIDTLSLAKAARGRSLNSAIVSVLRTLAKPSLSHRRVGQEREAGDIASVAFTSSKGTPEHSWAWPLRVGLLPRESRGLVAKLNRIKAAREGFLDVQPATLAAQDLFILSKPTLKSLRELQEQPLGLALIRARLGATTPTRSRLLKQWLTNERSVPAAFVDIHDEAVSSYVDSFTHQMSHDAPLDEAVFDAFSEILQRRRDAGDMGEFVPPVLLVPEVDTGGALDEARLAARVRDLLRRLRHLPQDAALAKSIANAEELGISPESRTVADLQKDLARVTENLSTYFSNERKGASVLPSLDAAVWGLEAAHLPTAPVSDSVTYKAADKSPLELDRFTDLTLYREHLYANSDLPKETKVADDEPLIAGKSYTLEVAIRHKRSGIDSARAARRATINPRTDEETLTVYVFVRSKCQGLKFEPDFISIAWPYNTDSDSALLRIELSSLSPNTKIDGKIEVLLYHSSLDLLDMVEAPITVVSEDLAAARVPHRTLTWPEELPTVPRIDVNAPPRLASIHVSAVPGGFHFDFKFRDRLKKEHVIRAYRDIHVGGLTELLESVRTFWTDLVIHNYALKLHVSTSTYEKHLKKLAKLGQSAARLLFGDGYADKKGTGEVIGELLEAMAKSKENLLQITYSKDAAGFVFPWSIVYPTGQDLDKEPVKLGEFWGLRYTIEQVDSGNKADGLEGETVDVTFVLDPSFGDSQAETDLFDGYVNAASGKLKVEGPIKAKTELFNQLSSEPASHIYYFFCHGWSPDGGTALSEDRLKLLEEKIAQLDAPEQKMWSSFVGLLPKMGSEPWIFIGDSELKESTLRSKKFFKRRRPIVFLNMCHSAGLLPSMNSGLARVFIDRNASAIIGTESPMTPTFAHPFAKSVLDALLGGKDVGTALLTARHHFLDKHRNPLGLAYTLYGRGTARFGSRPIINAA